MEAEEHQAMNPAHVAVVLERRGQLIAVAQPSHMMASTLPLVAMAVNVKDVIVIGTDRAQESRGR